MTTEINFTDLIRRVREDEVASLEAFRKGSSEAPTIYHSVPDALKVASASEPLTFIANEETEDRAGDVVKASAWDLVNFKKNPVLAWVHDYRIPPIGTWAGIHVDGRQLLATANFDTADAFAAEIERKYRARILRAVSVGFRALEFEQREAKDGARPGYIFTRAELLEISAVPIPMHPRALRKGLALAESAPTWVFMPGDTPGTFKAVQPTMPAPADGKARAMADLHRAAADAWLKGVVVTFSAPTVTSGFWQDLTSTTSTTTTTGGDTPPPTAAVKPKQNPPDGGQGDEADLSAVVAALKRVRA